jgi:CO dehydrogenase/acetyl-CoA synthase delta subunit
LEAAARRYQKILRDVLRREAKLLSFGTIDIKVQKGLIKGLLHAQVRRTRGVSNVPEQLASPLPVAFQVATSHLNVDGRWQSEI